MISLSKGFTIVVVPISENKNKKLPGEMYKETIDKASPSLKR